MCHSKKPGSIFLITSLQLLESCYEVPPNPFLQSEEAQLLLTGKVLQSPDLLHSPLLNPLLFINIILYQVTQN